MEREVNYIDIDYLPGPVATEFHHDRESRVKLLIGPFGTGKSSSGLWDLIDFASDNVKPFVSDGIKRTRFAIVRNTYQELKTTTLQTFFEWFPEGALCEHTKSDRRILVKMENKEIELFYVSLETPKDVQKLLSFNLTGAFVDEAREMNEAIFEGLLGRMKRYPSKRDVGNVHQFYTPPQLILATNYPAREHYLYRDFVKEPKDGYAIYEQKQGENKHNLADDYYEDLAKDYSHRPDLLKTLVYGDWGVTVIGRTVYPEFDRHMHVATKPLKPLSAPVIRCWDNTGLNPACAITQISPTGQWLILKEFCGEDVGIEEFCDLIGLYCNQTFKDGTKYRDIGDPAGRQRDTNKYSPAMYMKKKLGINVEDGIQTPKTRREAVSGRLTRLVNGRGAIQIDPGCLRIIDGFEGGYSYKEIRNTGVFDTSPLKNKYSHIHDAVQYGATKLFLNPKPTKGVDTEIPSFGGPNNWMH